MTMNDRDFVNELIAGEPEAFERLIETYQDQVLNTCYRFVQNHQDAEDVAQEVFIEVIKSIEGFRGDAKLSTWIYRVATTRALDFVRKKNRKKRFGHLKRMLGFQDDEGRRSFEPEDSQQPVEDLERQERATILQQAVASLPDNQRAAITLNQYEGLSCTEVADIMGTTVSAVESLLFRAKKNLRKQLYHYYDEIIE
ncbi:RNA polymerase sigma factor [Planctomycetota bacterium]